MKAAFKKFKVAVVCKPKPLFMATALIEHADDQ